jgi:hypothetical protein
VIIYAWAYGCRRRWTMKIIPHHQLQLPAPQFHFEWITARK